ncbi:hypothetical protein KEM56_000018 [Ascosphaera pollenicola]|nr:hypothetical protein KEM56_000018 [Ascosphaera pollenicola]
MMAATRKITLICLPNKPVQGPTSLPDAAGPQHRRLTLSPDQNETITLGRASDHPEKSDREPLKENALFRCRVVSKEHAKIGWWNEQYLYIQDLNSLHGTYVNNELLPPGTMLPLNHHDIVQLGICFRSGKGWINPVRMRVEFDGQEQALKPLAATFDFEGVYDNILNRIKVSAVEDVETTSSESRSESEVPTESESDDEGDTNPSDPGNDIFDELTAFEEKDSNDDVAIIVGEAAEPISAITPVIFPEGISTNNVSSPGITHVEVETKLPVLRNIAYSPHLRENTLQNSQRPITPSMAALLRGNDKGVGSEKTPQLVVQDHGSLDLSGVTSINQSGSTGTTTIAGAAKRKLDDVSDEGEEMDIDEEYENTEHMLGISDGPIHCFSHEDNADSLIASATSRKARKIDASSPGQSSQMFVVETSASGSKQSRTLVQVTDAVRGATRTAGIFASGVLAGGAAMAGFLAAMSD